MNIVFFATTCNHCAVNTYKLVVHTMVVAMILVRELLSLLPYYIAYLPSNMIFSILPFIIVLIY